MNEKILQSVHRVTALFVISAIIFYLFFQVSKNGVSREINPFGNDPYDAVGSFAYQLALLIGLLTYARVLRFRYAPEQAANKVRLILRGNITVLVAIAATLIADAVAEIRSRLLRSY